MKKNISNRNKKGNFNGYQEWYGVIHDDILPWSKEPWVSQ